MEKKILKPFFDEVCNPKDWKAPIDAFIRPKDKLRTAEAILFFTATTARFEKQLNGWLRVIAKGYRNGPAGDH